MILVFNLLCNNLSDINPIGISVTELLKRMLKEGV